MKGTTEFGDTLIMKNNAIYLSNTSDTASVFYNPTNGLQVYNNTANDTNITHNSTGNINLKTKSGKVNYNGNEVATINDIQTTTGNYLPLSGGDLMGVLTFGNKFGIWESPDSQALIIMSTDERHINFETHGTGKVHYNGNEVATIATFATDSEAEAYSTANPNVLVISTQQ